MLTELCPYPKINTSNKISIERYLIKSFAISKQQIKKHIKKRQQVISDSYVLKISNSLINIFLINPVYNGPKITYKEDDLFIYFDKPHNIYTHPLEYNESNNLLSFMRNSKELNSYIAPYKNTWDKGFINRLDFVTSGILIYAKDPKTHRQIRENFQTSAKEKYYIAIVNGNWQTSQTEFSFSLASSGRKKSKIIVTDNVIKNASMKVKKIEHTCINNKQVSILFIKLKTGLRHQIRAFLSHYGHTIVGDTFYGDTFDESNYSENKQLVLLHAYSYKIELDDLKVHAKSIKALQEIKELKENDLFRSLLNTDTRFQMIDNHFCTF